MKLNRENLLHKTRQGLQIYVYILRQYYPSESLYLQEDRCKPVQNPFNFDRRSLSIFVKDGLARHRDLERPEFTGDALQFADLHLKCATQEELLFLLNQVLELGLKVAAEDELEWLEGEDDSWIPRVSYFKPPVKNILPNAHLSLREIHEIITGNSLRMVTEELRAIKEPAKRRAYKASHFPYVTFAGTFDRRKDDRLEHPSFLLVFDFDKLEQLEEVKHALLSDRFLQTELLFTSPSGNGLKWVIRRDPGSRHQEYFRAVENYLQRSYNLKVDPSGRDVSRACFLTFVSVPRTAY